VTRLFDTHCHLQDRAFAEGWRPVVERARVAGVTGMTLLGYDAASNLAALEMAGEGVFAAVGYHPHDAKELDSTAFAVLEAQAADDRVVAIGEIGLDFYRDLSPHDVQRDALDRQLALAARVGKPVCLHSRSAEEAIEPHLQQYAAISPLGAAGRPVGVATAGPQTTHRRPSVRSTNGSPSPVTSASSQLGQYALLAIRSQCRSPVSHRQHATMKDERSSAAMRSRSIPPPPPLFPKAVNPRQFHRQRLLPGVM